MLNNNERA